MIKDTLKAFGYLKKKQQKCMEQCFLIFKSLCILDALFNTIYIEEKQILKKKSLEQNKRYKKCTRFSFVSSNAS